MIDTDQRLATAETINRVITAQRVYDTLARLQSPAPSTTVLHTRTPILQQLMLEAGVRPAEFNPRLAGTRSPGVLLDQPKNIWIDAHADTIIYLFPKPTNETTSPLNQNSAHRPKVARDWPAKVLRYNTRTNTYDTVSEGVIGSTKEKGGVFKPYYTATNKPKDGFSPGLDRVVYKPILSLDEQTRLVTGNMDNAAGIAAVITAIHALSGIAKERKISLNDFSVGFLHPDEEEGLELDSAYFARGARRVIHRTPNKHMPVYIVNIDGHDTANPQPVVLYASAVSGNKGPVVPPDVYDRFENFLIGLHEYGVSARRTEEGAGISRSDDAGYMEVHDQVVPIGYGVRHPHFNDGAPTANLDGLVQTAKAVAWIAADMAPNLRRR